MATLTEYLDYYNARMAYQYADLPRASANIRNYVAQAVADNFLESVQNAFTIDTAIGVQLDTIGKYIGVSRIVNVPLATPYFGFWDYEELDPSEQNPNGFYDYSYGQNGAVEPTTIISGTALIIDETTYFSSILVNGDLVVNDDLIQSQFTYAEFYSYLNQSTSTNSLSDGQYRFLLKMQIVLNSSDATLASIQEFLLQYFQGQVRVIDNTDMTLNYFVSASAALPADVLASYLPKPMGVGMTVIET